MERLISIAGPALRSISRGQPVAAHWARRALWEQVTVQLQGSGQADPGWFRLIKLMSCQLPSTCLEPPLAAVEQTPVLGRGAAGMILFDLLCDALFGLALPAWQAALPAEGSCLPLQRRLAECWR